MDTKINSEKLHKDLLQKLSSNQNYPPEEIRNISFLILESILQLKKTDIITGKEIEIANSILEKITTIVHRFLKDEPIQYILGESYFYGRKFKVNNGVLIPRPETEELCQHIVTESNNRQGLEVLDICTGSGCIAITLKKELADASVAALDISKEALEIAQENADMLEADIRFFKSNILIEKKESFPYKSFDIIVSNPPYVLVSEKVGMRANVLDYEPGLALFVPDEEALIFYERIIHFSQRYLKSGGRLYFEINENFGEKIIGLMNENNFHQPKIYRDMQHKDRFVSGVLL